MESRTVYATPKLAEGDKALSIIMGFRIEPDASGPITIPLKNPRVNVILDHYVKQGLLTNEPFVEAEKTAYKGRAY